MSARETINSTNSKRLTKLTFFSAKKLALASTLIATAFVTACETAPSGVVRNDTSASGPALRGSVNEINYADIRSVSNGIIQDIFFTSNKLSRNFDKAESDPFRVVVRSAYNGTTSDRISTDQFLRVLEEELINTGIVVIHTRDSADWEYALDARLDSTTAQVGNTRQTIFNLALTMTSIENVKVGIWSDELQFTGRY